MLAVPQCETSDVQQQPLLWCALSTSQWLFGAQCSAAVDRSVAVVVVVGCGVVSCRVGGMYDDLLLYGCVV